MPADTRDKIKWPQMTGKEWEKFDDDMERILQMTLTGPAEKKLVIMTRIILTIVEDSFGVEKKQPKRTVYHPSRREREITNIRKELRTLAKRYRRSGEEERKGLSKIRIGLRRQLKGPRKKERIRKKTDGERTEREQFREESIQICVKWARGEKTWKA